MRCTESDAIRASSAGRSRLSLAAWHFQRSPGDSVGTVVPNRERLSSVGAALATALSDRVSTRLGLDGRIWKQGTTDGVIGAGSVGLGVGLTERLTLSPEVRYERGRLEPVGGKVRVRGWSGSVFLRSSW